MVYYETMHEQIHETFAHQNLASYPLAIWQSAYRHNQLSTMYDITEGCDLGNLVLPKHLQKETKVVIAK